MSTGILPQFWTPSDIQAAQQSLAASAAATDTAVASCTSLDATTKANWNAFYVQLQRFTGTTFGWLTTSNPDGSWSWGGGTGSTANLVEQYARTLYAWQQKLASTCNLGQPTVNPDASPGSTATTTIVKYAAIGAAFVASAYIVGRVVSVIPRRTEQLPEG